jgi:hypothetical protein
MKMQRKKILIAMAVTITIFLSMFSAINLTRAVNDPSSFYTVTNGNLNTDTYTQYPFELNNVSFGFSQFGELIGIVPGADQTVQSNWVGMSYDGNDPFARNTPQIAQHQWINGWYLYISYIDPNNAVKDRNLWAFATFSDGHVAGGNWVINLTGTPTSPPYSGRKTNGMVITDPLQVLYNSPREYIAQATNHIYDNDGTYQWPVVDLIITMIFDKVSKQVILYKDVKVTIQKLDLWGKLDVQLSDREEYDLGPSPTYDSYAHFYEENGTTDYTPSWTIPQNLTTDYIEHQVGSSNTSYNPSTGSVTYTLHPPSGLPLSPDYIKVYVDGVFQDPSLQPAPYVIDYNAKTVTLITPPLPTSKLQFNYKYIFKSAESMLQDGGGGADPSPAPWYNQYDVAQVISSDNLFVAWAAFWPPTSSHTVDGILNFLTPFYNTRINILSSAPKRSPLIIGQWDIAMDPATFPMFRAVEVKGICNDHNAVDPQQSGEPTLNSAQALDVEAKYQLASVFQPYDLHSAITKNLNTWVDYYKVKATDILGTYFDLELSQFPVHLYTPWETYNSHSERVFLDGTLQYPIRNIAGYTPTYELYVNPDGTGYVEFASADLTAGDVIKVIYATDVCNYTDSFSLTPETKTGAYNTTLTSFNFGEDGGIYAMGASWEDTLDVNHTIDVESFIGTFSNGTTIPGNTTWTYNGGLIWEAQDFTVFKEDTTSLEIGNTNATTIVAPANGTTMNNYNLSMSLASFRIKWTITGPNNPEATYFTQLSDVQVSMWDFYVNYTVTVHYILLAGGIYYFTVTGAITFTPRWTLSLLYKEEIPGRYEWGIVGATAKSIDSAGLSMITAALKDKEVEYGIAGQDIAATDNTLQMPSIFSQMSTGTSTPWSPYYYSATDLRTALGDDWDPPGTSGTNWQIARANLVGSGGPLVNMLAYYGNDFATAFYGISTFTSPYSSPWNGAIVALSCWNSSVAKAYYTSAKYGYAVVSTFEDLNGTTGLLVYGVWGRDTYYAANWFYQDLAWEFQSFPCGATSIVLKITYNTTTFKPKAFNVVEVLGTISETGITSTGLPYVWNSTIPLKGGIHPDP